MTDARPVVLVTGARGKIGTRVTAMLIEHGFHVRGLASSLGVVDRAHLNWVVRDLRREDLDFTQEVSGVVAVVHLGAELDDEREMFRTNVQATLALARAARDHGARLFCFASSISVYGSARSRASIERSPLLTADDDVRGEYWANGALRAYGRSKVAAEAALAEVADRLECVVLRPTVVVDEADVLRISTWGRWRRAAVAARRTHHLFVDDLAAVVLWAIERSSARPEPQPGLTVFNVSDDSAGRYAQIFPPGDETYTRVVVPLLGILDWARDVVRFRRWPVRRPLGYMSFPADALRSAGFTPPNGMAEVRRRVLG